MCFLFSPTWSVFCWGTQGLPERFLLLTCGFSSEQEPRWSPCSGVGCCQGPTASCWARAWLLGGVGLCLVLPTPQSSHCQCTGRTTAGGVSPLLSQSVFSCDFCSGRIINWGGNCSPCDQRTIQRSLKTGFVTYLREILAPLSVFHCREL